MEIKLAFIVWVTALKNLALVSATMATAAAKTATASALAGWATVSQAATVGAIAAAQSLGHAVMVSLAALKVWTASTLNTLDVTPKRRRMLSDVVPFNNQTPFCIWCFKIAD